MSDMWQVPEGLAESLLEPDPCADARNDAWANGVEAGKEYVGRILKDLIAELRAKHVSGKRPCWSCSMDWPCSEGLAIEYAEARLRDVSMSLSEGHGDE